MSETERAKEFLVKYHGEFVLPQHTGQLFSTVANTPLWLRKWFEEEARQDATRKVLDDIRKHSVPCFINQDIEVKDGNEDGLIISMKTWNKLRKQNEESK